MSCQYAVKAIAIDTHVPLPPDRLDTVQRELEVLKQEWIRQRIEWAAPGWVNVIQRRHGAPDYLWDLLMDELNAGAMEALTHPPGSLQDVPVAPTVDRGQVERIDAAVAAECDP